MVSRKSPMQQKWREYDCCVILRHLFCEVLIFLLTGQTVKRPDVLSNADTRWLLCTKVGPCEQLLLWSTQLWWPCDCAQRVYDADMRWPKQKLMKLMIRERWVDMCPFQSYILWSLISSALSLSHYIGSRSLANLPELMRTEVESLSVLDLDIPRSLEDQELKTYFSSRPSRRETPSNSRCL